MTIHPDHLAGRLVALGAIAGLLARDRTGVGDRVDVAQFEAVSTLIGDLLLAESLEPGAAQPTGNSSTEHAPWGLFRCADDGAGSESWLALCVTDGPRRGKRSSGLPGRHSNDSNNSCAEGCEGTPTCEFTQSSIDSRHVDSLS